jgi:hydroxylysine kinase
MRENSPHNADSMNEATPDNSDEFTRQLVQRVYGIKCQVAQLACERDQIFKLHCTDKRSLILRFTNPGEDYAVTDFQTRALQHVAASAPIIPLPRIVKSLNHEADVKVTLEDNRESYVRVISCLPGIPLTNVPDRNQDIRLQIAALLAQLGRALKDFNHPASGHELLWDMKRASQLRQYMVYIEDREVRQLATRGLDNFEHYALARQSTLRSQVIHNDLNFSNLLIAEDSDDITGIIDFGDMVYAPLINDLAVAAAYQLSHEGEDSLIVLKDFVLAYHQVQPLHEEELTTLYDLIITRQVLTLTITAWRASLYPENKGYILRNQPIALKAIKRMFNLNRDEVNSELVKICLE